MLTISQNLDRQASQSCAYIIDTCSLAFSPGLLRKLQYSFHHGNIKDKIYYIDEVAEYFFTSLHSGNDPNHSRSVLLQFTGQYIRVNAKPYRSAEYTIQNLFGASGDWSFTIKRKNDIQITKMDDQKYK